MEQGAMVYDNPGFHRVRGIDRPSSPPSLQDRSPAEAEREQAVRSLPTVSSDPLLQIIGTMRMGAILVARDARVVYLNEAGKDALAGPGGLALRGDQVVTADPDTRRRLVHALERACRAPFVDGALLLHGSHGGVPAKPVRIVSMQRVAGRARLADEGLALLCIGCARSRPPDATLLGQLFALTPAEAALMAAIAGGERLHECASRRGVSLATVRAQLRNVFVKTGAATQAELTLIAWTIPGLWID